jgi:hypothetical protein
MSTTALAQFLEIKNNGTRVVAYQSYWPGQTVNGYTHFPFSTDGIIANNSGGETTFTIRLPAIQETITLLENGLTNRYLARVQTYQFDPPADNSFPAVRNLVAQYDGEFVGGTTTQTELTIVLGSTLDSISAQVPPRTFTSALVGQPPRF